MLKFFPKQILDVFRLAVFRLAVFRLAVFRLVVFRLFEEILDSPVDEVNFEGNVMVRSALDNLEESLGPCVELSP